jgi:putative component of toxin-antitoxin plasmid stabilization module
VKGSKIGLWELRVTNKGSTPPHLRVFYLRRGRTIWVASGITKQKNSLSPADIRTAESIAREWSSEEGSP